MVIDLARLGPDLDRFHPDLLLPPLAVIPIPVDGATEASFERGLCFPTEELAGCLGGRAVSGHLPGALPHESHQRVGFAERLQHSARDRQYVQLAAGPHVDRAASDTLQV